MKNNVNNAGLNKNVLNWLVCIYDDHHLNPYKIGAFKN